MSAAVVAGVAAYSSYGHQRVFALEAGADPVTAAIWPLSVDGLAILSSIGLLDRHPGRADQMRRLRWALRLSFLLSVAVSLAANVAAAPVLSWQAVLVAGWPPLALLLAVELVMHDHVHRDPPGDVTARVTARVVGPPAAVGPVPEATPTVQVADVQGVGRVEQSPAAPTVPTPRSSPTEQRSTQSPTPAALPASRSAPRTGARSGGRLGAGVAEAVMWAHCEREWALGRVPSGAELDRVAGTRSYGRAVLARWRRHGRIPSPAELAARVVSGADDAAAGEQAPGDQSGVKTSGDGRAGARLVTVGGRDE